MLKPIVNQYSHILKNSTQLIQELEGQSFLSSSILVTADINSLYPSIPTEESINIILEFLENFNNPTYPPVIIINNLLRFILDYNCFTFGVSYFLQVREIAMGTKMAPNYPNLFMVNFENKFVFNYSIQLIFYKIH